MDEETLARRAACTDTILGNGLPSARGLLAGIDPDTPVDQYGTGGVVAELEAHVAQLLGKPAALFLPSGTMAQGAMLRVHADRRSSRTVIWHPACHLERYEEQAHQRLHGLVGRPIGGPEQLLTADDVAGVAEPFAALVLELPQRELGGALPGWDDLVEQTARARERGAAVHLDGARLWEAAAGYGRSPAEIAALFDTVYVSFYKSVGALPGCCVAGSQDDIAQLREWRRRLGGTLFHMWPSAASALGLLGPTLDEMPARMAHALAIAEALRGADRVRVLPDPPQTPMMHLLFDTDAETFRRNARRHADEGLWVWPTAFPTGDPRTLRTELTVGRATLRHDPSTVAKIIQSLTV